MIRHTVELGKSRRLIFFRAVITASRPNKIEFQMMKAKLRLPAILESELNDNDGGVEVKHELDLLGSLFFAE